MGASGEGGRTCFDGVCTRTKEGDQLRKVEGCMRSDKLQMNEPRGWQTPAVPPAEQQAKARSAAAPSSATGELDVQASAIPIIPNEDGHVVSFGLC
jgi:hypothetical protein